MVEAPAWWHAFTVPSQQEAADQADMATDCFWPIVPIRQTHANDSNQPNGDIAIAKTVLQRLGVMPSDVSTQLKAVQKENSGGQGEVGGQRHFARMMMRGVQLLCHQF